MADSNGILPLKDIVNKVISNLSEGDTGQERISEEDINRFWRKAAGKFANQRSRPTSLRKGKLVVVVEDSSLLYDLTLRKREILEILNKELKGKIQDIQFRIGETSEKGKTKDQRPKTKK